MHAVDLMLQRTSLTDGVTATYFITLCTESKRFACVGFYHTKYSVIMASSKTQVRNVNLTFPMNGNRSEVSVIISYSVLKYFRFLSKCFDILIKLPSVFLI